MREDRLLPRWIKLLAKVVAALVVAFGLAATVAPHYLDRVYYQGAASDHFDGRRFANPDGDEDTIRSPAPGGRAGLFWRFVTGSDGRPAWPDRATVRPSRPAARVFGDRMVATWIGHATVLVQTSGLNILTDPVWSEHAGPFGLGPRRVAAPGVRFEDLPPIDLVVVSHNHYDHMDLATLKRLWDRDKPVIITSLGNDAVIRGAGIPSRFASTDCGICPGVQALDWGGGALIGGAGRAMTGWMARPVGGAPFARVTAVRNHHWGSRWFADRNRALWSAFVISTPSGSIFFAGDTGLGDGRWPGEARAAALSPIRLAIIPIGAFRFAPGQMASGSHIGPIYAAEVHERLGASYSLPIHWGTFRLSYEGYRTPPLLLAATLKCTGQSGFPMARIGRPVEVPPYRAPAPARRLTGDQLQACLDTPAVRAMR